MTEFRKRRSRARVPAGALAASLTFLQQVITHAVVAPVEELVSMIDTLSTIVKARQGAVPPSSLPLLKAGVQSHAALERAWEDLSRSTPPTRVPAIPTPAVVLPPVVVGLPRSVRMRTRPLAPVTVPSADGTPPLRRSRGRPLGALNKPKAPLDEDTQHALDTASADAGALGAAARPTDLPQAITHPPVTPVAGGVRRRVRPTDQPSGAMPPLGLAPSLGGGSGHTLHVPSSAADDPHYEPAEGE